VLMAIPSVLAEAGFATGAGVSGAFAVVGCGVSGFLSPHIMYWSSSDRDTHKTTGARPWCKILYLPGQNGNKRFTGVMFLKVTRAGGPAGRTKHYKSPRYSATKNCFFKMGRKLAADGYCSAAVPPALCMFLVPENCRQDAAVTQKFNTCEARPQRGLESLLQLPER